MHHAIIYTYNYIYIYLSHIITMKTENINLAIFSLFIFISVFRNL